MSTAIDGEHDPGDCAAGGLPHGRGDGGAPHPARSSRRPATSRVRARSPARSRGHHRCGDADALQALVERDELLVLRPRCRGGRGSARRRRTRAACRSASRSSGTTRAARSANSVAVVPGVTCTSVRSSRRGGDRPELLLDRERPSRRRGRPAPRRRAESAAVRTRRPPRTGTVGSSADRRLSRGRPKTKKAVTIRPAITSDDDEQEHRSGVAARTLEQRGRASPARLSRRGRTRSAWPPGTPGARARRAASPAPPASSGRPGCRRGSRSAGGPPGRCGGRLRRLVGLRAGCCACGEVRVGQVLTRPGGPRRSGPARGRDPPCASAGRCRGGRRRPSG